MTTADPAPEVHVSSHADPSKDEYLELEKKLGAAEYEIAENLADSDQALGRAIKKGNRKAKTARTQLKRKLDARAPEHD